MNPHFLPNLEESKMIETIQKYCRNDFALIRMTKTMLEKSIIDASGILRKILKDNGIVNFNEIVQGKDGKIIKKAIILTDEIIEENISYYRPETKKGDPRFWIYRLSKYLKEGDLLYITVWDSNVVSIPLVQKIFVEDHIKRMFRKEDESQILSEIRNELKIIKEKGWIKSVGVKNGGNSPKDVGETLEQAMGIKANNLFSADFKGQIEIKTKRASATTNDTLFCLVPDWEISQIKSAAELILKYGYPSNKYKEFIDLYVTVSNIPNNQGLFLDIDDENNIVFQNYEKNEINEEVCKWKYDDLKERLLTKHPKTVWIMAEEKIENGEKYFKYTKVEYTQNPIFTQFLYLIQKGIVVYDWRGRIQKDGKKYKDKGHAFRMNPKNRKLLFGDIFELEI